MNTRLIRKDALYPLSLIFEAQEHYRTYLRVTGTSPKQVHFKEFCYENLPGIYSVLTSYTQVVLTADLLRSNPPTKKELASLQRRARNMANPQYKEPNHKHQPALNAWMIK